MINWVLKSHGKIWKLKLVPQASENVLKNWILYDKAMEKLIWGF